MTRRELLRGWIESQDEYGDVEPSRELVWMKAELRALWAIKDAAEIANSVAACSSGEWSDADYELSNVLDAYNEGQV